MRELWDPVLISPQFLQALHAGENIGVDIIKLEPVVWVKH